jgi:PAS domain-containing protein
MDQGGGSSPFYNKRYSADNLQRLARTNSHSARNNLLDNIDTSMSAGSSMMGGQSLDEMVQGNDLEQQRRRRSLQQFGNQSPSAAQMMGYGSPTHSDYNNFGMSPGPIRHPSTVLANGGGIAKRRMQSKNIGSLSSPVHTASDAGAGDFGIGADPMAQSPMFHQQMDDDSMNLDMPDMGMGTYDNSIGQHTGGNMDFLSQPDYGNTLSAPVNNGSSLIGAGDDNMIDDIGQINFDPSRELSSNSQMFSNLHDSGQNTPIPHNHGMSNNGVSQGMNSRTGPLEFHAPSQQHNYKSMNNFSTGHSIERQETPRYLNAYSQSGFDMLGVLMRVSARPKPQINIGAVDMSCAFVVCDVTQHDVPIVYCSEMFERLTGYVRHEILGRNCRFLQAPDSKVQAGIKRKYVDDKSVYHLKSMINQRQEAQISLINYRKGGQPFMNLLTMIPIAWDTDEIRYFVGFQVDLVEQPTSITNKNPGKHLVAKVWAISSLLTLGRWVLLYQLPTRTSPALYCTKHSRNKQSPGY